MTASSNVRLDGVSPESIVHISTWGVADDRDTEGDDARWDDD
ncbi:hypothetical protein [Haloprofundus marisrubri]|nr:hypothetical protein [Haloprofundus marisrubri]